MTGIKRGLKIFTLLFMLSLMICYNASALTIAVSPTTIDVSNAARGVDYEKNLIIFNPNDQPVSVDIQVEGDAKEWIKIYDSSDKTDPISELYIQEKSISVIIGISVPQDALNGNYAADILVVTKAPEESIDSQMGSAMSVQAKSTVNIDVSGEEIISGTVEYIKIGNSEVSYPVPIEVSFLNIGNVVAKPEIFASVQKDGEMIDSVSYSGTEVKPGKKESIIFNWNNSEPLEPGTYVASVSVTLNGNMLSQKDIEFELSPQGTFTREGELTDLVYEGTPSTGKTIKISGLFVNKGQIPTKAKLKGEIYRDGSFEEAFESDEYTVSVSKTEQLVYYLKPEKSGSYRINVYVVYEDKKTNEKEVVFDVVQSASQSSQNDTKTPLSATVIIGALSTALIIMFCKKK